LAPSGIPDPRVDASATRAALAAPAGWVRGHAGRDAVLLFYSPVYAEALAGTRHSTAISRSGRPLAMAERADYPASSVVVALPLYDTLVRERALVRRLGARAEVAVFPGWLIVKAPGPFASPHAVWRTGRDALVAVHGSTYRRSFAFRRQLRAGLVTVCDALAELREPCSQRTLPRQTRG
ncbi:MAG: hypothetical protein ICV74_00410, partial [Thermoleophilia bacterium]|nr:hypothetical protein [Thermoleophilia bacterium]